MKKKVVQKELGEAHALFSVEDRALFEKMKEILRILQDKYGLSKSQLSDLLSGELLFPDSVFSKKLTPLHSVVKYLKENKALSYGQIAELISRDQRNVWRIYHDAKKRHSSPFLTEHSKRWIPISILSHDVYSAQEALVVYLRDVTELSFREIAQLLKRDDRTIWTVYMRAKKK